ncbi:MAG: Mpv17/PMP22 family protein [Bacteroidales bacterium]|nr:Mpv17/PMP22 family protein [Bacteroidales bacterium]MCF8392237.1 Mpv17/PMP22 family protein [Bacteroidales bacterium]
MKDLKFSLFLILFFAPFFLFRSVFDFYFQFNIEHGLIMSFIKFAILATMGEVIGLRIRTGNYNQKGFGILPRALVWGFLGLSLKAAFDIFAAGTPIFLENMGMQHASEIIQGELNAKKVLVSFSIGTALNLFYAPVLMTVHKITDNHIANTGGTLKGLFSSMDILFILKNIDWDTHWNFILKRTIPLFWIPAQTITFLLPPEYRILFAAFLGIVLGVLLAVASLKGRR